MKQLVCEMCGSTDLLKDGGVFICQSCGCKYSVEEAKKMMVEGTVEVQGTVKVDNSGLIANYLSMAENAYDASNNKESEDYCNKIIEIDPTNYKAWLIKGKAAGWQSSLANNRFLETINAFEKALDNCPEDEREDIVEETKDEIKKLSHALANLRCSNFEKFPDDTETDELINDIGEIAIYALNYILKTGETIDNNEIMGPIANGMNIACCNAWKNKVLPDYLGDENRPNDYEFTEFIHNIGNLCRVEEKAIEICSNDDDNDVQIYKNLIVFHNKAIEACSWDYSIGDYGYKRWYKNRELTDSAKEVRRNIIKGYENKIKEIEDKKEIEKIEKIEKYWEEHKEEKNKLDDEKSMLLNRLKEIDKEFDKNSIHDEITSLEKNVNCIEKEYSSISIFRKKEKNEAKQKIEEAKGRLSEAKKKLETIKNKVIADKKELSNRLEEIESELSKER